MGQIYAQAKPDALCQLADDKPVSQHLIHIEEPRQFCIVTPQMVYPD